MPVHTHKLAVPLEHADCSEHVLAQAPFAKRDWTRLAKLRDQQVLTCTSLRADSLDFLADWSNLRSLRMHGCKIGDYSALAKLKRLSHLFLNGVRSRTPDLSFLGRMTPLTDLGIVGVPHLTAFPDLSRCTRLKRLSIYSCKRLSDLSAVLRIPNLESFQIVCTPQEPADLEPIMAMPKMKVMSGAFGRAKKDAEFHLLLAKHGLTYG